MIDDTPAAASPHQGDASTGETAEVDTAERDATGHDRHACPYCPRAFARADYRDLHLGIDHGDRLSAAERERYEDALAEEERRLRLFRYKALFVLVLVYFGFIVLYAFSLGGR